MNVGRFLAAWSCLLSLATGCSRDHSAPTPPAIPALTSSAASAPDARKPAPDFELKDVDGHAFHLADLRGKIVVLEWFNPKCPFVNAAHTKGSLKAAAARHIARGAVWLGIDSAAPGRQGYDPDEIRDGVKRFGLTHPILRDETGVVGHAYEATNTPHMFVIDTSGRIAYAGAIDNSPDGEGESPTGGSLVNYVDEALADLAADRPVRTPRTKAYGCSVKYGS
jgi:peroxiredoxin